MNFLHAAQQPTPRNEEDVKAFSRLATNFFGFFVYGILYGVLFLSLGAFLGFFVVKIIYSDYSYQEHEWLQNLMSALLWGTFGLSWWPFAKWVQKRIRNAKRLFRDGFLLEGRLSNPQRRYIGSSRYTIVELEFSFEGKIIRASLSVGGHPAALFEVDATCPVIYHPEVDYCYGFYDTQNPTAAKILS